MAAYEEYLDPAWRDEFTQWRGAYRNPYRDLQDDGRSRNWDDERRLSEQYADGIVAEITFPNTVPPFYPTGALVARPPSDRADYERRFAGISCHNRWLRDWCARHPDQRRGLPQTLRRGPRRRGGHPGVGRRGGVPQLPAAPHPARQRSARLLGSPLGPALGPRPSDLDLIMTQHGGNGGPDYGKAPAAGVIFLMEVPFYSHRNLAHLIMSGCVRALPEAAVRDDRAGVAWLVEELRRMDGYHRQMRAGRVGELGFAADIVLPHKPSEYFDRNVWIGASFPSPGEAAAMRKVGVHKVMWGSDYPHHEGTYPYSLESLQRAFSDWSTADMRAVLGANAAELYGFDLDRLAPLAAAHGPSVEQVATPPGGDPRQGHQPRLLQAVTQRPSGLACATPLGRSEAVARAARERSEQERE